MVNLQSRRVVLLGAGATLALASHPARAQSSIATLRVGGLDRRYRLFRPAALQRRPALAIALHGMGVDSISLMPLYSGLDDLARAHGFLLAYPASRANHWPLSFGREFRAELDFFDALVNDLVREHDCDPQRIYLLGMSNGGYFANVIAGLRSRYLAGLAIHSGSAGVLAINGVDTQRKFPVYVAHGASDTILPPQNGRDCARMWRDAGHAVQYEEVGGLGHIWARDQGVNARIWAHWTTNAA